MKELKEQIQSALGEFSSVSLTASAAGLLNVLGYESERTFQLSPNNYKGFADLFQAGQSNFDTEKAKVKDWQTIDIIFQLTEDDIKKSHSLFETKKYSDKIIESYLFFALSLTGDKYTRGDLVRITREINKLTPMPAMILFKYNNYLTVAVIDRRLHKRESTKDVLEKVTLIKDINIPKPHRAHIEILFDLSLDALLRTVGFTNFVELHNAWRKTLDTSELNKKFFRELANWYFWALRNVEFPDDAEKDRDVRNAISVIRMITRTIFVWFLKEKGLVPDSLFIKSRMDTILNYSDKTGSTFYKAILQNLFFATLNTEMNKDKPGNRIFVNRQYGIPNLYRYERFFKDKGKALALFESIPFLNGGLFECLDKNVGQENEIRIDCFSNSPAKSARLTVPDELFFSAEQSVDLNEIYGTKNKTYIVRGLIDILDSYKFTVDENTPIEEEIALDPELLGKVFENLLASYNPETQTTARKQTGSFYTPREIVNYMVDESIIAYLSTKLIAKIPSLGNNEKGLDERLRHLVAYNDDPHKFTPAEADILIAAINTLKALDPACGSGAFPMGMLHKLVYILGKLDPDNSKWRELQKQKAIKETEEAYKIGDKEDRAKRLLDISEVFENNASDYGRKLYLIENCIFGVDIQPIAVQIAKLRFFVSLIVDQRIDPKKANLGIRPLPNLETKFVAANTLIGLDLQGTLRSDEVIKTEKELKAVREKHFTARTPKTKEKYRSEDARLRVKLVTLFKGIGYSEETTNKLTSWNPYDQNASAEFFDPEWMFEITEGFDVVTGNPPYIQIQSFSGKPEQKAWERQKYATYVKTGDVYCLFYEKGFNLLASKGILTFITSNKWMRANYGKAMRKFFLKNGRIAQLIDFGDSPIFENATTYTNILVLHKSKNGQQMNVWDLSKVYESDVSLEAMLFNEGVCEPLFAEASFVMAKGLQTLMKKKIEEVGVPLKQWDITISRGIITGLNEAFIINGDKRAEIIKKDSNSAEIIKPVLRGRDIKRYKADSADLWVILAKFGSHKYLKSKYKAIYDHLSKYKDALEKRGQCRYTSSGKPNHNNDFPGQHHWLELDNNLGDEFLAQFDKEKIMYAEIVYDSAFFYDVSACYPEATSFSLTGERLKYLTALLNSRLLTYAFKTFYAGGDLRGNTFRYKKVFLEQLPVPKLNVAKQRPFEMLVDQILAAKKKDPSADTSALEKQIDEMVYALYGLTPEEIALVEGKK